MGLKSQCLTDNVRGVIVFFGVDRYIINSHDTSVESCMRVKKTKIKRKLVNLKT